ncbi:MAG: porin [Bacteroidales bacterium]|nr:porin [Bacteroidales bacterium]
MKKIVLVLAALCLGFGAFAQEAQDEEIEYGYKQTGFMSTPKVGGYIIGGYKYSDKDGANGGPGFNCRLIRLYVDGSIFNDFKYRIQFQANGTSPHVKDFFVEWAKYKEFSVKLGQFKRAFTFENPMNPWDVGVGDFSLLVQKMAGMGDRLGEANMGGRDVGIQVQGDFLPIGDDKHRLIHYQLGVYNGQGINLADANKEKDIIGTLQFQPIKGLYLGGFLWRGSWVKSGSTTYAVAADGTVTGTVKPATEFARRRASFGAKYDRDNWTFRAEYAMAFGGEVAQSGKANAFYVTAGIPLEDWLKVYVKWDNFTDTAAHNLYSACANFRLHKNLNFQLEYRRHQDQHLATPGYDELWALAYIRF